MAVNARQFVDDAGKTWTVSRAGSMFEVLPKPAAGVKLHEVARSCANVVGVTLAPNVTRSAHINEHFRIWGAIWNKGEEDEIDLDGNESKLEEHG